MKITDKLHLQIDNNFKDVQRRIILTAQSVNRDPDEVRLMVVTKGQPINVVNSVIEAGGLILGENYVEEATLKIKALENKDVEWHMIGHIQSRKARQVCEIFNWVHSIDRYKIAQRLDRFAGLSNKKIKVLLECNVSGESSKYGYPIWLPDQWPSFMDEVSKLLVLPNLEVRGLMTMPPWHPEQEISRPFFQRLRKLRNNLAANFPDVDWHELSMGMSNDFEVAIQEGATIIRVGTAIVGPRSTGKL
jgi:pyridoxal phosphate enzyme (YggS family)